VYRLVADTPVVEALVRTDEEAKRFCVNVLRKRKALVPRVYVPVVSGTISRKDEVAAATARPYAGEDELIPTLPLDVMLNH
jgi:hypothetical protein